MKHTKKTRFVFEGVGTRGDVAPLIVLGEALVARGNECHLLAAEAFAAEATRAGMHFVATGSSTEHRRGSDRFDFEHYLYPALTRTLEYLEQIPAPCVVINADRFCSSNLVAERASIPTIRLHLAPFKLRSLLAPPAPFSRGAAGPFRYTYLEHTLPRLYDAFDRDPRILSVINRRRAALGLGSVTSAAGVEPHVCQHVALFPRWYCEPAPDWPRDLEMAGFPLGTASGELPRALTEFLEREGPPLVFTPGTGATDVDDFFHHATASCEELGLPGVFLSPHARATSPERRPPLVQLAYVDLGLLLGRAALLVHHGGIGTTARALQAGVPQIISPLGFDQPDNAARVAALKVGRVIERAELSGRALAREARTLLEDAACRAELDAIKRRFEGARSVERCVDLLEQQAGMHAGEQKALPGARTRPEPLTPVSFTPQAGSSGTTHTRAPRTVLFVIWPELGHVVTPLALARQLRERGDRVVFAGAGWFRPHMPSADVEFLELCGMPGPGAPPSIFSTLPGRAALPAAVDALVRSFELAFRRYRPSLVLLDSLYSALGILVHAAGIAWATYETDLPRELDPMVPPPSCCIVPGRPESPLLLRRAWATCLWQAYLARQASRKQPVGFAWSMTSYFPDALIHELERRFGRRVEFDRRSLYPPVARAPRLVFCPRELDFERSGSSELAWVGPCIDERRPEPHFRFQDLPANVPLAYCALGTRSLRSPEALELLRTIVRTFAERDDFFLVLACPERQREALGPELAGARRSVWAVAAAPQLALLRRASLAIIHAGFNSVKECAAYGVPMLALPLSHDQPRNAALISYRGLGVALDFRRLTRSLLHQRLTEVRDSAHIRANGLAMRDVLRASMARGAELDCIDALIDGGSARAEPHVSRAEAAPRASSGVAGSPGLGGQAEGCAVS